MKSFDERDIQEGLEYLLARFGPVHGAAERNEVMLAIRRARERRLRELFYAKERACLARLGTFANFATELERKTYRAELQRLDRVQRAAARIEAEFDEQYGIKASA